MISVRRRPRSLRVDPFGFVGIDLAATVVLPPLAVPLPGDYTELALQIPAAASLRNTPLFTQLVFATDGGIRLGNVWPDRIE